jgi:2-polyprenyl-3-methyl-5-hydroxy-6-metoxy-1,4-benzoquinol methylase
MPNGNFFMKLPLCAIGSDTQQKKKMPSCALRWRRSCDFRRKTLKAAQNPYDAVAYPGQSYPDTHPGRMAAIAILQGLSPAPVESCRVLEIACGDGANLIPMAYAAPSAEFVGFDLARLPVERGQRRLAELGLKNIRLFQMNVLDAGADLGRFDYIIAHGLYAWVPEPVRDRLLALCSELLTEDGVAFISYNAMPGGHLRFMIREMMLFGGRGCDDPEQEAAEGLKFLHLLMEALPENDVYRAMIKSQVLRMEEYVPGAMRHDELSGAYHPVYFTDFVDHARRHGLQYLSEAQLPPPPDPCYKIEPQSALGAAAGDDFFRREQMLDFVRMRAYRETLLCRADRVVLRGFPAEHFRRLLFASQTTPAPANSPDATVFMLPGGVRMESNHPGVRALLPALAAVWPRALAWEELEPLLAEAGLALDADGAGLLVRLAIARMIELRAWKPPLAPAITERPSASACSRHQIATHAHVTSLLHATARFEDAKLQRLLVLLDGARDRRGLLEAMSSHFPEVPQAELETGIEHGLQAFLRAGVLEA